MNVHQLGVTSIYDPNQRSVTSKTLDAVKRFLENNNRNIAKSVSGFGFTPDSAYGSDPFSNPMFWEDLWTIQAVTLWLTDGKVFEKNFPKQVGMISAQGFRPADPTPILRRADGRAVTDLGTVLRPIAEYRLIQGPDGIYGNGSDSIIAEYARTGNVFGKPVPSTFQGAFNRFVQSVTSSRIADGIAQRLAGNTAPAQSAVQMSADTLAGDAQINSGFAQTRPAASMGQTWSNFTGALNNRMTAAIKKRYTGLQRQPRPQETATIPASRPRISMDILRKLSTRPDVLSVSTLAPKMKPLPTSSIPKVPDTPVTPDIPVTDGKDVVKTSAAEDNKPAKAAKGLSTGAKVGIGVGVAAVLGIATYAIISSNKKSEM